MRKPRAECRHETINFGSGDFYLFCRACGARWATIEYTDPCRSVSDEIAPRAANKGVGSLLSGEPRSVAAIQPQCAPDRGALVRAIQLSYARKDLEPTSATTLALYREDAENAADAVLALTRPEFSPTEKIEDGQ